MASAGLKLFREGGLYTLGLSLLRAGNFVLLPVYTGILTQEEYGAFGVVRNVVNLLVVLAVASQGYALLKLGTEAEGEQSPERSAAVVSTLFTYVGAASVVFAVGAALAWPLLGSWVEGVPLWPLGAAGMTVVLFEPLFRMVLSWLQFHGKAGRHTAVSFGRWAVMMVLVLLFLVLLRWRAEGIMLATGLSFIAIVAPSLGRVTGLRPRIDRRILVASLVYGLPLLPHAMAGVVFQATDQLLLAANDRHGLGEAGQYMLAAQLASAVFMLGMGIERAWVPFFMREDRDRGSGSWERVRKLSFLFVSLVATASVGMSLLAPEIVELGSLFSGRSYAAAAGVVPILAFGAFVRSYYLVASAVVMADKKMSRMLALATLPAAGLTILLNALWIPEHGMRGAAWATFTSHCLSTVLTAAMARMARKVPFKYVRAVALLALVGCVALLGSSQGLAVRLALIPGFLLALLALDGRDIAGAARSFLRQARERRARLEKR